MVPEIVSAMTFHLNQAFDGTAKSTDKIYKEKNPKHYKTILIHLKYMSLSSATINHSV